VEVSRSTNSLDFASIFPAVSCSPCVCRVSTVSNYRPHSPSGRSQQQAIIARHTHNYIPGLCLFVMRRCQLWCISAWWWWAIDTLVQDLLLSTARLREEDATTESCILVTEGWRRRASISHRHPTSTTSRAPNPPCLARKAVSKAPTDGMTRLTKRMTTSQPTSAMSQTHVNIDSSHPLPLTQST
jgi:hypothetical protein